MPKDTRVLKSLGVGVLSVALLSTGALMTNQEQVHADSSDHPGLPNHASTLLNFVDADTGKTVGYSTVDGLVGSTVKLDASKINVPDGYEITNVQSGSVVGSASDDSSLAENKQTPESIKIGNTGTVKVFVHDKVNHHYDDSQPSFAKPNDPNNKTSAKNVFSGHASVMVHYIDADTGRLVGYDNFDGDKGTTVKLTDAMLTIPSGYHLANVDSGKTIDSDKTEKNLINNKQTPESVEFTNDLSQINVYLQSDKASSSDNQGTDNNQNDNQQNNHNNSSSDNQNQSGMKNDSHADKGSTSDDNQPSGPASDENLNKNHPLDPGSDNQNSHSSSDHNNSSGHNGSDQDSKKNQGNNQAYDQMNDYNSSSSDNNGSGNNQSSDDNSGSYDDAISAANRHLSDSQKNHNQSDNQNNNSSKSDNDNSSDDVNNSQSGNNGSDNNSSDHDSSADNGNLSSNNSSSSDDNDDSHTTNADNHQSNAFNGNSANSNAMTDTHKDNTPVFEPVNNNEVHIVYSMLDSKTGRVVVSQWDMNTTIPKSDADELKEVYDHAQPLKGGEYSQLTSSFFSGIDGGKLITNKDDIANATKILNETAEKIGSNYRIDPNKPIVISFDKGLDAYNFAGYATQQSIEEAQGKQTNKKPSSHKDLVDNDLLYNLHPGKPDDLTPDPPKSTSIDTTGKGQSQSNNGNNDNSTLGDQGTGSTNQESGSDTPDSGMVDNDLLFPKSGALGDPAADMGSGSTNGNGSSTGSNAGGNSGAAAPASGSGSGNGNNSGSTSPNGNGSGYGNGNNGSGNTDSGVLPQTNNDDSRAMQLAGLAALGFISVASGVGYAKRKRK